eukprot:TRINITY_DN32530_c0_g1_i1.p1 TRINITY_DN32530_c0_g1~~TRINITY_DN32530_c0_g1_i1.p1  ORF type:complete len:558 (-),score=96.97 TRINITY_DN32530_c0_g1_i1:59-1687(-)
MSMSARDDRRLELLQAESSLRTPTSASFASDGGFSERRPLKPLAGIHVETVIEQVVSIQLPRLTADEDFEVPARGPMASARKTLRTHAAMHHGSTNNYNVKYDHFCPRCPPSVADVCGFCRRCFCFVVLQLLYVGGAFYLFDRGGAVWPATVLVASAANSSSPSTTLVARRLQSMVDSTGDFIPAPVTIAPAIPAAAPVSVTAAASYPVSTSTLIADAMSTTLPWFGTPEPAGAPTVRAPDVVGAASTFANSSQSAFGDVRDSMFRMFSFDNGASWLETRGSRESVYVMEWWILSFGLFSAVLTILAGCYGTAHFAVGILDGMREDVNRSVDSLEIDLPKEVGELVEEAVANGQRGGVEANLVQVSAGPLVAALKEARFGLEEDLVRLRPCPLRSTCALGTTLAALPLVASVAIFACDLWRDPPQLLAAEPSTEVAFAFAPTSSTSPLPRGADADASAFWSQAASTPLQRNLLLNLLWGVSLTWPFMMYVTNKALAVLQHRVNRYLVEEVKLNLPGGIDYLQQTLDAAHDGATSSEEACSLQ